MISDHRIWIEGQGVHQYKEKKLNNIVVSLYVPWNNSGFQLLTS